MRAAFLFLSMVLGTGMGLNICDPTPSLGCFCDDMEPYLISCNELKLTQLPTPKDWTDTIEKMNLTDRNLDVRFDFNSLEKITAFPAIQIVSLSLQNNGLHEIEDYAFRELDFLLSLDLSHNEFTAKDLPEQVLEGKYNESSYRPLPLQHLNLSYNNIHTLEEDLLDHLPDLTSLDLSHNPLKILGGATSISIAHLMNLKYLNLAYTKISSIPEGMIHRFLDLESLDLGWNEFVEVPSEIRNSHNLKVLTLDGNKFEKFDKESFDTLTSLEDLSISHMKSLRMIEEETFGHMKNLTRFYCHHNPNLDRFSNAAFYEVAAEPEDWPVMEMYLNDNGLTHIDKAMAAWNMVRTLDIQNNPFRCDCLLRWMSEVLVDQIERTHPHLAVNIVCAEPKDLRGDSILELGLQAESFSKCKEGAFELNGQRYEMEEEGGRSVHQGTAITILIIGVMLIVIGLSILGVLVVKRRAIASALIAHQQIRYQRADNENDEDFEAMDEAYKSPSSAYRVA